MVTVELMFLFTLFVICQRRLECKSEQGIDWSLYQRVHTLQIGLIQNENLDKYMRIGAYWNNDNTAFIDDQTKVKRSYNTEQCIKDLRTIQEVSNDGTTNWANEMLGAWGKLSSVGIDIDFGNFDRCQNLKVPNSINIETQYCLANIAAGYFSMRKISPAWPRVGICIPNSCAPSLISTILNDYLDSNSLRISIASNNCRLKNDNTTLFFSYKIFIAFLTTILGLVILSSLYDVTYTLLEAYTNGKNLLECKSNQLPNVMPCLDGIRAIAAFWILSTHFNLYTTSIIENGEHDACVADKMRDIFSSGRFSVDTFFVLSALLAANKMLNEHSKNGRLNIPLLYLQRVVRLSPMMMVIALFNRFLVQFCANGPAYSSLLDDTRWLCENAMWDSILFFANFRNIQCVPGSWYLAADMHMYILTPFLVLLLQRYPRRFMGFSFVIVSIDFILSLDKDLFGLEGYNSYVPTRSRITPWLIGVNFAYILLQNRSRKPIRIPKFLNAILLAGSVSVFLWFTYTFRDDDFMWRARAWWSISLCFIIFSCVNGQGGIINWFLSHPRWQPISRLSFNIFLVHQTVIWVILANRKVPLYFSDITQVQELFLVVSTVCGVAFVLALTVEIPTMNLSRIYLYKNRNLRKSNQNVPEVITFS
ncbi:nose resistant to fluoxetine protein 6-like isoform X2 [Sitodiplosis mosellana]|uniref:nose resistant to fluoxetine protein 6-like isoform X2 n=1 Tax=Sitodiplosis mosellana TaxID=263140 RepID=UPI002444E4C3|nr:nose resistant to fluoxetine protein 6-like isoform X2 [Sitodiplosis mosellana]